MTVQAGPDFELQKAIVTILRADTDVKTLLGASPRIYQDVPDQPTFPYVTVGEGQETPDLAECIDGSEIFPVLHVWSRTSSFEEAKKISATLRQALIGATFSLSGHRCLIFERDELGDQALRDPDGITKHIASHYRAVTEPT